MPKQMLPLIEDHSMFRTSVERISGLFAPEDIFVVTGRNYAEELRQEVPHIPASNFIIEPYAKNTAPALALALATIQSRDPEAMVAILTADHHIADPDKFCGVLQAAKRNRPGRQNCYPGYLPFASGNRIWLYTAGSGHRGS